LTSGGFHGTTADKQLGGAPCSQFGNRRQREPATRRKDILVKLGLHGHWQFTAPKLDKYFYLLSRAGMVCKEEGVVARREVQNFEHTLCGFWQQSSATTCLLLKKDKFYVQNSYFCLQCQYILLMNSLTSV